MFTTYLSLAEVFASGSIGCSRSKPAFLQPIMLCFRVGDKIWRHCICGRSGVSGYCCQQQPWQHAYCALVNRGSPPWLADVTSAAGTNACAGTSALAGVNVSAGDNSQQACTHTGTEEGLHGKARWTGVVASQSPAESRERTQLPQSSLQVSMKA